MKKRYILALDQGTSSSKGILLNSQAQVIAVSDNFPIPVHAPHIGWVAYDPHDMLDSLVKAGRDVIRKAGVSPSEVAMIGLANQGETVIGFDRETGDPVGFAISWQDRRTKAIIQRWQDQGLAAEITARTGLKLDPYFSAAKMRWILENEPAAPPLLEQGRLCLATSDTWLIGQLTAHKCLLTDIATASRTMLLNLETLDWDPTLLEKLEIPRAVLPDLAGNATCVGMVDARWFEAEIPLGGLCVDQQAALFGQHCFHEGEAKLTFGTGCFMLANIGSDPIRRSPDLLTSVGWQMDGVTQYVLDGGIYTAGAVVDWMVDRMQLVDSAAAIDEMLAEPATIPELFFIPALSGLAAPYWEPDMKGTWHGLTLAHDRSSLVKSAMEAIGYRVKDIFELMATSGLKLDHLKVDGGLTRNRFLMQLQANLLGVPIHVMEITEATALGVGLLSGLAAGLFSSKTGFPENPPPQIVYRPDKQETQLCLQRYQRWCSIVQEVIKWPKRGIPGSI
ncbi:MAG: FGGY family carbohydrate kinase [bacterium]